MLKLPKQFSPDFSRKGVKPTGPVEIDWSNPLSKDLLYFFVWQDGQVFDLVTSRVVNLTTNGTELKHDSQGAYLEHSGRAQAETSFSPFSDIGSSDLALFSKFRKPNSLTNSLICSRVGNGLSQIELRLSGNAEFLARSNTAPTVSAALANSDDWQTVAGTKNGGTHKVYINGIEAASASITNQDLSGSPTFVFGGLPNTTAIQYTSDRSVDMGWARSPSSAELKSLDEDPYQLLKPASPQVYYTADGAPSGTTGTLNSTLTDITSVASGTVSPAAITGTLTSTLTDTSMVASGQVFIPITGTIASTLDDVTSVASGFLSIIGTSTVTLEDVISNSSGIVAGATAGTINVTLEDATSVSSGILTTIGTINTALDDAVMVASGIVHVPITGTVSVTLADTVMVASGVVIVIGNVGTVNSILDDAVMTASGNVFVPITGTVSVTLEDVIVSSIGIVEVPIVPGSLVGTIGTSGTGNFTWWAVE